MIYQKISSNSQTSSWTGKIGYMQSKQLSIGVGRAQKHSRVSGRWGNWEWQHKAIATHTGGSAGAQMKSLGLTVETHVENLWLQEAKTRVRPGQTFRALLHIVTNKQDWVSSPIRRVLMLWVIVISIPSKLFFQIPAQIPQSHFSIILFFPASKKGKSQLPFYPFRTLYLKSNNIHV